METAFRIPQPQSVELARQLVVGARVARYWHEPYNDWFEAEVLSVDNDLEANPEHPDDIPEQGALYVLLCYPPQKGFLEEEQEDVKWDLIFNHEDGEVLNLPDSARPYCPHFVPPGGAARSRQVPRVDTPSKGGRPSSDSPPAPNSSGKRKQAAAGAQAAGSGRLAKRARAGAGGKGSGARKRRVDDDEGLEGTSKLPTGHRPGQERHHQREPEGSNSLCSGPADTAGVAGMLLRLQQGGAQPPRGGQQQAGLLAAALQPTPSQHWQGQAGGCRRGAAIFTQQGGSQAGLSGAGGSGWGGGRGGGGGDGLEEAFEAAQPTQRRRGRAARQHADFSSVPDPAGAPCAGTVKSIEVFNLMCHEHLALELGPNVNLIAGINGSGKSTLLVALQCCLGARASDTGRSRSMAKFVRTGFTQAAAKVTLWNTGAGAYRRDELGPELTVVRKINLPSGGSHEIQDCKGRTVLRGSAAVQELVDELGICCSNPAIVLTQEMAKAFANLQSEKAKYFCFMQATEFQKIVDHLREADDNIVGLEALAKQLEADVQRLAEQEAALASKLDQMKEIEAWQRHHADLEKCLTWGAVYSAERFIASLRDVLENTAPAEAASRQARINSYAQQIAVLDGQLEEQRRVLAQAQADMDGRQTEEHSLRDTIKARKREVAQLARQLEEQQREAEELAAQARELAAADADVAAEFAQSTQQQVDAYKGRVAACRDQCERATVAASSAREYLAEREAVLEQARTDERAASQALAEGQQQVATLQAALRSLEAAQVAPLAKFGGPAAVELHRAVQQAVAQGRFSRPPLHIGSSLSLADDRWAAAVDVALGRLLSGWIVHSGEDRAVLQALCRRLSQPFNLTAVVMSFDIPLHTIPPARLPPPDKLTVRGVLRFAEGPHSHVLKNALIDHQAIERKILTETQAEALALTRDAPFWHRYSISTAIAKDGSSAYRRRTTETALPPPRGLRPRLGKDTSQQVADCRTELQQAQAALAQLQQEAQQRHQAALEAKRDLDAAVQRLQAAKDHKQTCDTQYADARSHQPLVLDAADAGGTEAARRLAALRARAADAEARAATAEDELAAAQEELGRLQTRQKEAHAVPQHVEAAMKKAEAAINKLGREKQTLQVELNTSVAEQAALEAKQVEVRGQLSDMERSLATALEEAEAVCSREDEASARRRVVDAWKAQRKSNEEIAGLLDCKRLQRQAEALERRINQRTADAGIALEDLENEHARVRNKRWKLDCRWDRSEKLLAAFRGGWRVRKDKFRQLRSSITTNISKAFGQYLNYRGHRGFVEVDHREQRLALAVGPNGQEPTRNMGSLSGGERSISSLAFILALGKEVQPPFVAMDEFDVFMDSVNRRFALQFLLEFAVRHPDRQLLLLTPQDISVLEEARVGVEQRLHKQLPGGKLPNDFVKVVQMAPPRGRQQAPPPSQQG